MHAVPVLQIDAFTASPFRGNPAAVCLLESAAAEPWMQRVAAEMNLSETAFVVPRSTGVFGIRWFTPRCEVPLCGHATLASAHALWSREQVSPARSIEFHSRTGSLTARRDGAWIRLDFPALPPEAAAAPERLTRALGHRPLSVHRNAHGTYLVELKSEAAVRELQPDLQGLRLAGIDRCIVTAPGTAADCDFVSRFFAPGLGIDEDPVTGSAHCTLAPFWAARLGRAEMTGHQVSKRGGVVRVRLEDDRVELRGQAVTVWTGTLAAAAAQPSTPAHAS